jgi:AcrR family transcriptional regulator
VPSSPRNRQGADTRRRIIRVAEKLFAEQGVEGVSIRAVNAACGIGAASIHYHFGSRDKLLEAVVEDHGTVVANEIRNGFIELQGREKPPTPRELVETLAGPAMNLIERQPTRGLRWVKIIAQLSLANDRTLEDMFADINELILEQVMRAFPGVDADQVALRWTVASRTLFQMLSHVDHWMAHEGVEGPEARRRFFDDLAGFVAGGLEAIAPATSTRSQRRKQNARAA